MAKKAIKDVLAKEELVQEEVVVKEEPKTTKPLKQEKPIDRWEVKDREYYLLGDHSPVMKLLRSKGIYWFDEEKGYEREIKLTTNQRTVFVDEFKGDAKLEHIIFRDGVLNVPRNKVVLQQLLSLYHPGKGKEYDERNNEAEAQDELFSIEMQLEALNVAKNMDIDQAEAIVRTESGSRVSKMTSKEIKRDLMVFAKNDPYLFLELANDENINIRNIGIKAVEEGILSLSSDQRTFMWGKTKKKIMTVPFDENPYSALTHYFKTDEGLDVYRAVEKRLK
tara:strand:- start:28 stop:864 length:837 start_codon:yes stop_codon:yes gene_type:complete